ncbi:MAG: DUF2156 domain-containing protein [Muribaculaceae bacterium]|nr:DUF2156 domain-containing protein [Muribaculaceae bacterium]
MTHSDTPLSFRKITHSDMPLIWQFLERETGRTTDFSYAGLFMWVDLFKYEFAVYRDTLFIKGVVENDRSIPAFSLPIGALPLAEAIEVLKEYCRSENIPLELSAVPEYAIPALQALTPRGIEPLSDWSDYLYDAEMLATLKGKKMMKKRNHVNHFITCNPDWLFLPLDASNAAEAQTFMDVYDSEADETFMAREESRLSRKMIDMIAEGDPVMHGGVLYDAPGHICAITIGDVKGDTLYVHIEKATRAVSGSYEMINKEFASHILDVHPEVMFINREDDSGDEGLRKAKESYHPVDLLKKFNVIF